MDSVFHDVKVSFQNSLCVLFINKSHQVEPQSANFEIGEIVFSKSCNQGWDSLLKSLFIHVNFNDSIKHSIFTIVKPPFV